MKMFQSANRFFHLAAGLAPRSTRRGRQRVASDAAKWCRSLVTLLAITLVTAPDPALADRAAWDPNPADGDLLLPAPDGLKMAFRPIRIGQGGPAFALRKVVLGSARHAPFEPPTATMIGGAFPVRTDTGSGDPEDWVYYLGKYEVSVAQWHAVMGTAPDADTDPRTPVVGKSVHEVQTFLHRYNLWLYKHADDALPDSADDARPAFVRLPTEAEWEFAARGGTAVDGQAFARVNPFGADERLARRHEHFAPKVFVAGQKIAEKPIGTLRPNPLGLYDMLGNAREMTGSLYQLEYYQGRVGGVAVRGASVLDDFREVRVTYRGEMVLYGRGGEPFTNPHIGIRLVIAAPVRTRANTELIRMAWPAYAEGIGADSVARLSVDTATDRKVQALEQAEQVIEQMRQRDPDDPNVDELERLFAGVRKEVYQGERDLAKHLAEIATDRGLAARVIMDKLAADLKTEAFYLEKMRDPEWKDYEPYVQGLARARGRIKDRRADLTEAERKYVDAVVRLGDLQEQLAAEGVAHYKKVLTDVTGPRADPNRLIVLSQAVVPHAAAYREVRPNPTDVDTAAWFEQIESLGVRTDR